MPSRSRQFSKPARRPKSAEPQSGERLQKVLAAAGVGSRRACEELILEGRVEVDRKVVRELGTRVDPEEHEVRVDGVTLATKRRIYFLLNKPEGVVTTNRDPDGRPRVIDMIRTDERLFAVGRLDMSTEGLILLTNDGEVANRLSHPRYGVKKTYLARVVGEPSHDMLEKLKSGVHLAEGVARVSDVKVRKRVRSGCELEIVLDEGKNREVRRLLAAVGHKVQRLKRIAIGPLRLGEMPIGAYRQLAPEEVRELEKFLKQSTGATKRKRVRPRAERPAFASRDGAPAERRTGRPAVNRVEAKRPVRKPPAQRPEVPRQGAVLTFDEQPRKSKRPQGERDRSHVIKPKGKRRP